MSDYKYDVAFSFLAQDEALATQLADVLGERHRVFLYSRKQEQLAGTDGEETFNDVFSKQARTVVVIYREGWGNTPWTRIEETAIKNRAYDEGYNFALFVAIEEKPTLPQYVPKTRLWIGLKRVGIDGAATVIDARIQEFGGEPRVLTLEDRAARAQRAADFKVFRGQYLQSKEGVQAVDSSYETVRTTLHTRGLAIKAAAPYLNLDPKGAHRIFFVTGAAPALKVELKLWFINSLEDACIEATIWNGHPPIPNLFVPSIEHQPQHTLRLMPDVTEARTIAWQIETPDGTRLVGEEQASEHILTWWLAKIDQMNSSA